MVKLTYIEGFHGTNNKNAKGILLKNKFNPSSGDKHWLGDGVYFYAESVYAYRWVADIFKYKKKGLPLNLTNLKRFYTIICVNIELENERIFDLTTFEHHDLYDSVLESIKKVYSDQPHRQNEPISEGVILNLMFNNLRFSDDFDIVINVYYNKFHRYQNLDGYKPKQSGLPEKQICVKNATIIKNINEITDKELWKKIESSYNRISRKLSYLPVETGYQYNIKEKESFYKGEA